VPAYHGPARRAVATVLGAAALAASLIVIPGAARAGISAPSTHARVRVRPTTPELIARAVAAGRITQSDGASYLTWAFTAPGRVPAAYRSDTAWDGTVPLLQLTRMATTLPAGPALATVRAGVATLTTLPCNGANTKLPDRAWTKHFFIEFNRKRLDGVMIGGYATALQTTWRTEVDRFGWPAPPKDPREPVPGGRYLARIQALPTYLYGYVTGTSFVGNNPATPWRDRDAYASCMVLNQNMAHFGKPLGAMRATVAHEFNHSLQFGMGALTGPTNVKPVWVEGGATWMEDEVFTGSNDNYNYLTSSYPDLRKSMPLFSPSFPYPYFIVFRAMTEQYGGTGTAHGGQRIMRYFWEQLSKNASTNTDAFKAAFHSVGSSLAVAYHNAGIALRFQMSCSPGGTHRPYCLKEAAGYRRAHGANTDNTLAGMGTPLSSSIANDFATMWVGLPASGSYPVTLSVTDGGAGLLKTSIVCREGSKLIVSNVGTATKTAPIAVPTYSAAGCDEVTAVISNAAETSASPQHKTVTSYTLDLGP
jgi:hypothetical protein